MPEYWSLVQQAKYLGVAPWDLEAHPEWINPTVVCMLTEQELQERERRKAKQKNR